MAGVRWPWSAGGACAGSGCMDALPAGELYLALLHLPGNRSVLRRLWRYKGGVCPFGGKDTSFAALSSVDIVPGGALPAFFGAGAACVFFQRAVSLYEISAGVCLYRGGDYVGAANSEELFFAALWGAFAVKMAECVS